METLFSTAFDFLRGHIGEVFGLFGIGLPVYIAKFVAKVPLLKVNKWLNLAGETMDVINEIQKATDEDGEGGGDITKDESKKIYKELREAGKALGKIKS